MAKTKIKPTTLREIEAITSITDRRETVEIILSAYNADLFRKYLNSLADRSNLNRAGLFKFALLQFRLLIMAPQVAALAPLYNPEEIDKIAFLPGEGNLVRVIFRVPKWAGPCID